MVENPPSPTSSETSQTMATAVDTSAASPKKPSYQPAAPTMGGLKQTGEDDYVPWTGGEPSPTWDHLDNSDPTNIQPSQYRPTRVGNAAKSQYYRTTGLEVKCTRTSDILSLQKKVMDHLVTHGMDTITYLPDPHDATSMVSVITEHAKFTTEVADTCEAPQMKKYDEYDHENVRDAKKFLINSLDEHLEKQIYENCKDEDSFICYWMNLMLLIRPVSIDQYDKIKERLKSRRVETYAGENIEELVSDFLSDWKELDGAGMYDHNLTHSMLKSIMEGGGNINEDFRSDLRVIKKKLNAKLLEIRHKDYKAQNEAMSKAKLDVQTILTEAKRIYREVKEDGGWPAASLVKDSRAMKRGYGAHMLEAAVHELKQSLNIGSGPMKKTGTCHNCGEPGHWAAECPKKGGTRRPGPPRNDRKWSNPKKDKGRKPFEREQRDRGTKRPSNRTGPFPPPKDGEREIKMHNGKKFYFCSKCNRWNLSHPTDLHKSKEDLSKTRAVGMARVDFDLQPVAFRVVVNETKWSTTPSSSPPSGIPIMTLLAVVALMHFVCICGTTLLPTVWQAINAISQVSITLFQGMWNSQLTVSLGILSGAISYYVLNILHDMPTTDHHYRHRTGTNFQKKWHRNARRASTTRGRPRNRSAYLRAWARTHLSHATAPHTIDSPRRTRYSHVPRPQRHDGPQFLRIRYLKEQIRTTRLEIRLLQDHLARLEDELKTQLRIIHPRRTPGISHPRSDTWPRGQRVPTPVKPTKWRRGRSSEGGTTPRNAPIWVQAQPVPKRPPKGRPPQVSKEHTTTPPKVHKLVATTHCFGIPALIVRALTYCINLASVDSRSPGETQVTPVLFDTGANCCITNAQTDFVGEFDSNSQGAVEGIGKGLAIRGKGHVQWTFKSDTGMYRSLKLPCFYVPSCETRIASVPVIMENYPNEEIVITKHGLVLSGEERAGIPALTVPFCKKSMLPVARTMERVTLSVNAAKSREPRVPRPLGTLPGTVSLTEGANYNLTDPEKELLMWHYRLGHVGMRRIQWLFRQGVLGTSERAKRVQQSAVKLNSGPLCTACQYAKQRRRTSPGSTKRTEKEVDGVLKADKLFPGQQVSIDHFHASSKGRLLNTFGKESTDMKYKGGCIFVDHASGYIHVELQSKLDSHQTLTAVKTYEEMCAGTGVVVQSYLSDNGTAYLNQAFYEHLSVFRQTLTRAGVGAHHSNGIAERSIGHVMSIARAMMHHSALHWPDVANVELWPLAVLHAVYILNRIPREGASMCPLELFTRRTWPKSKFHDLHVWGSPIYTLDETLGGGMKLPRWKPRSERGLYVGNSSKHSSGVPLVLNLTTGKITSQYHVIYDDRFQTVSATDESLPNFEHDDWYKTFGLTEMQYVQDFDEDQLPPISEAQPFIRGSTEDEALAKRDSMMEQIELLQSPTKTTGSPLQREHEPEPVLLPSPTTTPAIPATPIRASPPTAPAPAPLPFEAPPAAPAAATPQRENTRSEAARPSPVRKSPARPPPAEVLPYRTRSQASQQPVRRSARTPKPKVFALQEDDVDYWSHTLQSHQLYDDIDQQFTQHPQPMVYKAKKAQKDPDGFTWDEAMASEHKSLFLDAAAEEIQALVEQGTWVEDLKDNATTRIVPSQWVFRIKRGPDGEVKKFKARCVLRGDLQEYEGETYSPVAAWYTVRSMVVMCMTLGWITTCIDFSNAFVQSPLPEDEAVWMHVPRGFRCTQGDQYCLKLEKSLYGHKVAPLLWYKFVTKAFIELGLQQSEHDECLWYAKEMILVVYVDDCGIGAPKQEIIDNFVSELRAKGFKLTQEGSFAEFLGIKFDTLEDGTIELTQKGLINKILQAAKMEDCNPNSLPASLAALGADKDGEPIDEAWNYRAIVGMLLYLSTNTRPDISFPVSQIARFSNAPKKSHATAVKTLLRYLKKTYDKGMLIKPTKKFSLDLYVDADFCGLFKREDDRDPHVARSRSGHVILLCGCPLVWKSQLQAHITQSTTEAEYSALTSALRIFLPLKLLIEEIIVRVQSVELQEAVVHATVFEDNQSALYLATNQRITNRTKYFLAKWHWFWESYNKKLFEIIKCPTEEQQADYFTKALPKEAFERNRLAVQGW